MVHLLMPSDYNYNCWATEAAYRNDTAYIQKAMALPDPVLEPDTEVKQVDLDQVISLLYRKIVERTKCPQDQFREAYQMFGSPTTGIPFHEFRKNLHGLGVILEDEDALRLFNRFDSDGNGVLAASELLAIVDWVWASFHPGGEALDDAQKRAMRDALLACACRLIRSDQE